MGNVRISEGELAGTREIVVDGGFAHALGADDNLLAWWPEPDPRARYFQVTGQIFRASGEHSNPWTAQSAPGFKREGA